MWGLLFDLLGEEFIGTELLTLLRGGSLLNKIKKVGSLVATKKAFRAKTARRILKLEEREGKVVRAQVTPSQIFKARNKVTSSKTNFFNEGIQRRLRNMNPINQIKNQGKHSFKTLSGDYIKNMVASAKNSNPISQLIRATQQTANAHNDIINIMKRQFNSPQRQVTDSSTLSSSWCYRGTWISHDGFTGTLWLTTKIATMRDGKPVSGRVGKTYAYYNVSLSVGALMKEAMGWYGTGAGSAFGKTYLRGYRSQIQQPPFSRAYH